MTWAVVILAMAFSADGRCLVSGSVPPPDEETPGEVNVWRTDDGARVQRIERDANGVAFTPDSSRFAMLSRGVVALCDVSRGRVIWERARADARALALASRGDTAVVGTKTGAVEIWSIRTCRRTLLLEGGNLEIVAAALSSDGKHVAVLDTEETVYQWHLD